MKKKIKKKKNEEEIEGGGRGEEGRRELRGDRRKCDEEKEEKYIRIFELRARTERSKHVRPQREGNGLYRYVGDVRLEKKTK